MKRLFLCLFCLLLIGCSAEKQPETVYLTDYPVRISVILPHDDALSTGEGGYWSEIAAGTEVAAKDLDMDVKVVFPQINYDVQQLIQLIRQETCARPDAMIVQGIDDAAYIAALQEANESGILVVLVDTDVDLGFSHLYVGTDNLEAGRQLGRFVEETTKGKADILVISGGTEYPNVEERLQGLREIVEASSEMEILDVGYDHFDALTVMTEYERMLKAHPHADTIVCLEGTGGQTLSRMLTKESSQVTNIFVFDITNDVRSALEEGLFQGVLTQNQKQMGSIAVQEIYGKLIDGSYSASVVHTPTQILTQEVGADGE